MRIARQKDTPDAQQARLVEIYEESHPEQIRHHYPYSDWLAKGCPSFLDYGPEEHAIVEAYRVERPGD